MNSSQTGEESIIIIWPKIQTAKEQYIHVPKLELQNALKSQWRIQLRIYQTN